jgi:hypothetical protein
MQQSPERDAKKGRSGAEDRAGLAWKTRYQEQSEKLSEVEADLQKTRLAAEAALARRGRLEVDIKLARIRIKELLAKSETDDELISALKAECAAYRSQCAPFALDTTSKTYHHARVHRLTCLCVLC